MRKGTVLRLCALITLAFLLGAVCWWLFSETRPQPIATVAFLDVGQGDAIFVEAKNGSQMLIDAGAGSAVLRELPKRMGIFDRSIDIVVATHADADHLGGIAPVLNRYRVFAVVATDLSSDTPAYGAFRESVLQEGAARVNARRGTVIRLSKDVTFEVLYPSGDISTMETNDASIVGILHAGEIDFLLTGDAPQWVERQLVTQDGAGLQSEVIKAGHHGSKTSTGPEFVAAVSPALAIISAGKDNRYGHPHQQTLDTLSYFNIPVLSTATEGTIVFETDGTTFWRR